MENQKHKFQLKDGVSYINCAYMSPLLKNAEEKGIEGLKRKRNPFEVTQEDFFIEIKTVQQLFSELVTCDAASVAIMPSVSYGFCSVLNNISAKGKQKAVLVSNEFPSGYYASKSWCEKHGVELKIISPKEALERNKVWNEELIAEIDETTAFVLLSSVHWMDGTKFDLEQIGLTCKSFNAFFLVDGTQSVGALPMNVKKFNIDVLICASYKWLFGPYSCALAYISPKFNSGIPLEESWMNRTNAHDFSKLTNYVDHYFPESARYNVGETNDFIKMPILIESFRQVLEWDPDAIQCYCEKLLEPVIYFFRENGLVFENDHFQAKHILGIQLEEHFNTLRLLEDLRKNNVFLSLRGDFLRVSPNVYNTEEDVSRLLGILQQNLN